MISKLDEKDEVRSLLKLKRSALSEDRKEGARQKLLSSLYPQLQSFRAVLSFVSFSTEIDTSYLNLQLAKNNKLCLPKVEKDGLSIYAVADLNSQLLFSYGLLAEPDPAKCKCVELKKIDCVIVPGLGFDSERRRIGYGKGHYDRLLKQFKSLAYFPKTIGIGFTEQLFDGVLPHEDHDQLLDQILFI